RENTGKLSYFSDLRFMALRATLRRYADGVCYYRLSSPHHELPGTRHYTLQPRLAVVPAKFGTVFTRACDKRTTVHLFRHTSNCPLPFTGKK
ncbi:MAG TPA: hypothetical protein PLN21_22015, partial [Gemmatales bacterium]|nr:hypothetical protein [Gemmatales bacterium]